jgi:hypothetical protein
MDWEDKKYHRKIISNDLKEFFFDREIRYLNLLEKNSWVPKILDIQDKRIFLEFNRETLNTVVMERDIDLEIPSWKTQMQNIMDHLLENNLYKMTLYPHCFFIDKNGIIKTLDFYACVPFEQRIFPISKIEEMIGRDSVNRFVEATVDGNIDFEIFFNKLLSYHLGRYWPTNPFNARS